MSWILNNETSNINYTANPCIEGSDARFVSCTMHYNDSQNVSFYATPGINPAKAHKETITNTTEAEQYTISERNT